MAVLETAVLKKAKMVEERARKREISLESELNVKDHELGVLKALLERKEQALHAQRVELDGIAGELRYLKG